MVLEAIRMLAVDAALVLGLISLRRISLQWCGRRFVVAGIVLLLVEDAIRWAISVSVGFASHELQLGVDLIRQRVSLFGTAGAIAACVGLTRALLRPKVSTADIFRA